jgi:acyl-CoA synthetase (AMP-forming)/AMP-acid ligase II
LGGIQTPANAAYSASELEYQLKNSGAKVLFTCLPLLDTAREAARKVGIQDDRIYILEMPEKFTGAKTPSGMKTADDLIAEGAKLPRLEPLNWQKGDGAKRTAFLCYSSGTSGLPVSYKRVMY